MKIKSLFICLSACFVGLIAPSWLLAQHIYTVISVHGEVKRNGVPLKLNDEISLNGNQIPNEIILSEDAHCALFNADHGKRVMKKTGIQPVAGYSSGGAVRSCCLSITAMKNLNKAQKTFYALPSLSAVKYKDETFKLNEEGNKILLTYSVDNRNIEKELIPYDKSAGEPELDNFNHESVFMENGQPIPLEKIKDVKLVYRTPTKKVYQEVPVKLVFLEADPGFRTEVLIMSKQYKDNELVAKVQAHLYDYYGIQVEASDKQIQEWLEKFYGINK